MNSKPIIFNADMVRALLAGTKSQTRRVVKPCPARIENREEPGASWHQWRWREHPFTAQDFGAVVSACPYGKSGDLLYVKETHTTGNGVVHARRVNYRADSDWKPPGAKWVSPRFMPRWASRLTLRLTDVRVQRVQEIGEEDAAAEGVTIAPCNAPACTPPCLHVSPWGCVTAREGFRFLWDSINAKRGHGWDVNPWVWCLSFDVLHANVDAVLTQDAA